MAKSQLLHDDLLLLNRGTSTFKFTYGELANSLVIDISGDDTNFPNLVLNDLGDVNTGKYYDADGKVATGNVYNDGTKWMLQFDPTAPNGGEFILVDGSKALSQIIKLDDLADVNAADSVAGNIIIDLDGDGEYDSTTIDVVLGTFGVFGDLFDTTLSAYTGTEATDALNGWVKDDTLVYWNGTTLTHPITKAKIPDFGNRRLSELLKSANDGGTLEITMEGIKNFAARLQQSAAYKADPTISTGKYQQNTTPEPQLDDMIIFVPGAQITGKIKGFSPAPVGSVERDPDPSGEYYLIPAAEAPAAGDDLDIAGITDEEFGDLGRTQEELGDEVRLGGVRVANFKDTEVKLTKGTGYGTVTSVGTTPSNIGITEFGVLYADIPATLTFKGSLEVDNDGTNGAATTQTYKAGTGSPRVNAWGPGDLSNGNILDGEAKPGDFYVIEFEANITDVSAQILWNENTDAGISYPDGNGSALTVRPGQLVAFGGEYWNIIGEVSTENVAQDLQSVTTEGRVTSKGIVINTLESNGLVVGDPKVNQDSAGNGGTDGTEKSGGIIAEAIGVNTIDFAYIKPLPTTT